MNGHWGNIHLESFYREDVLLSVIVVACINIQIFHFIFSYTVYSIVFLEKDFYPN